ncbi:hypothetical protein P9E76_02110 [Schinkia azotoformans]|uniref:Uncharacterized protein n=1 Tax=Schinkia azotoformans LMG 9581 TaxID=1131731 RepID=K6DHH2_SCHAZ|nr:hypothetical protein [Schinkia azotoformans]EKN67764.1 hypothetical protein BAZO_07779 [Schinkia azotoformans LMG 9581]MEC1637466.1 hypothetical protein [Schinkia azotoformans]MEC1943870.1 hypothetical protein [Schinkia azotoformans]MED4411970.1 hypothetical protein [Schinkia azotoformans]
MKIQTQEVVHINRNESQRLIDHTMTVRPPIIIPARAPFLAVPFQKRVNKITGPNTAPKPAHA